MTAALDNAAAAERRDLADRVVALIDRLASGRRDDSSRNALLLDIALWQARHLQPYRRLIQARGIDLATIGSIDELPAIPTDIFRFARVAVHPPEMDLRKFLTSGTTSGTRGAAHLCDLSLYDRSARAAAKLALFPDAPPFSLLCLIPAEAEAPDSSLAYMVARFGDWFGAGDSCYIWKDGAIDYPLLIAALDRAVERGTPLCLLGTSFAFVFAEEELGDRSWTLPPGSRIMQTGGFKGRTRQVSPLEMRQLLSARYGVADPMITAEYGMTELSSQIYETTLSEALAGVPAKPRRLVPPPWVRVVLTDPEHLTPVSGDQQGLVRIEDPANLDTAWAVQTSDLARPIGEDGFELLGRAPDAALRGCSLAVEEALGSSSSLGLVGG